MAASLAAALPSAAENAPGPRAAVLDLSLIDLCDTRPELRHGTLRAIQDLLAPAGLTVRGRTSFPGEDQASGGVFVVLMRYDPSRLRTQPVGGVARNENGRQLTVWAFPPWVAGGLGLDLAQAPRWTARQRMQFQRAMAIVVVHELAHALAGAGHRPKGLMSARLGREQFVDSKLVMDADLHPAFLAGVAALRATVETQLDASRVITSAR
jgi:hypothetical protein